MGAGANPEATSAPVSLLQYLPNVSSTNPGKKINFVAHPEVAASAPDTFLPYQVLGCDVATPYPGTFFRFPLRSAEQAAASTISKQVGA